MQLGIVFAILAMFCWGIGDFFIQKSTRKIGDWETVFFISLFGSVVLLPFVWKDIASLSHYGRMTSLLIGAGVMLFFAALLEFEALRRGKISVIEPTWSLEIPVTVILAIVILKEKLPFTQISVIILLIIGLFLVSYKGNIFLRRFFLEKGVAISIIAACAMGVANFLVGWGAQESSPLVIFFFVSVIGMFGAGFFLVVRRRFKKAIYDAIHYPKLIFLMVVLDNSAWVAFAFAATLAPIGIVTAFSESYIVVAALLGIFVAREKLERHQKIGLIIAILSAIALGIQLV